MRKWTLNNFVKPNDEELKNTLEPIEYNVTQKNHTERPFTGKYHDNYLDGIYVDVVSGEPLFCSLDKYDAGCGWPSFSRPIATLQELKDFSLPRHPRIEVRSSVADSHLGHVFNDGKPELGGLRYCINSAALRFVPLADLEKEGYADYKKLFE